MVVTYEELKEISITTLARFCFDIFLRQQEEGGFERRGLMPDVNEYAPSSSEFHRGALPDSDSVSPSNVVEINVFPVLSELKVMLIDNEKPCSISEYSQVPTNSDKSSSLSQEVINTGSAKNSTNNNLIRFFIIIDF